MQRSDHLYSMPPSLTRRTACFGAGAAALVALTDRARALDWPTRPVTVIVPYSPGGNTDMMARLASQYIATKLGQSFVIENRPGGGGSIGAIGVARAQPDGYTLLFGASTQIINIPMLQKVAYDPQKDFVPVSIFGAGPYLLGIKASLPVNTLQEFVAYVKAHPGKLNYATAGIGGNVHLNTALFIARAGIDMVAVPYKSGAPAMSGLAAGEVEMYFGNASELMHHTDNKHIKIFRHLDPAATAAVAQRSDGRRDLSRFRHLLLERLLRAGWNAAGDRGIASRENHRGGQGSGDHRSSEQARDPAVRHDSRGVQDDHRKIPGRQPGGDEGRRVADHRIGAALGKVPGRGLFSR